MTIVLIGPVCEDLIIVGGNKNLKVGGASYFQSFVYEEFYNDYIVITNTSKESLLNNFPDKSKVKILLKDDTHYFVNEYPNPDNLDIRKQSSNFPDIPILKNDLEKIFSDLNLKGMNIDAFVLTPLNSYDFPIETFDYLKSFNLPIYLSLQGFLRFRGKDGSIQLMLSNDLECILDSIDGLFLDESEYEIIRELNLNVDELVITNGSDGSRIINKDNGECIIDAVYCEDIVDATGCGDTYMASYISQRLNGKSIEESGNFASLIASRKLSVSGPYRFK